MPPPNTPSHAAAWSASLLRRDLSARAHHLARTQNLLHDISPGSSPVVIFGRDEQGRHGNFHPASDTSICANSAWLRLLAKPHTASRRSRARNDWQWMEIDSANSSDALLMNIFCHPGVFDGLTISPAVANLLNIDPATQPCFGITPGIPLKSIRERRATRKPQTNPNSSLNENSNAGATKNPGAQISTLRFWVLEAPTTSHNYRSNANRPHRDRPPARQPLPRSQAHRIQLPDRRPPPHRTLPRPRNHLRPHSPPTKRHRRHPRLPIHPQRPRRLRL